MAPEPLRLQRSEEQDQQSAPGLATGQPPRHPFQPTRYPAKLDYLHLNPVEAGIVLLAAHYLLSSASNYVTGRGVLDVIVPEDLWNDFGYVPTVGL